MGDGGAPDRAAIAGSDNYTSVASAVNAVGAATAVGTFFFGAGVLGIDLKLWYRGLPLTFASALSRSQITTTTVSEVVIPVLLAAITLGWAISAARRREPSKPRMRWMPWDDSEEPGWQKVRIAAWTVAGALIETGAVLATLEISHRAFRTGVFRPYWQILLAVLILNLVATFALMRFLNRSRRPIERDWRQTSMTVVVLLVTLLPPTVAIWSCLHFPTVEICEPPDVGPTADGKPTSQVGSLVGTDGQYLYLAQYFDNPISRRDIEAIPNSSVTREYVLSTTTSPVTVHNQPLATQLPACPLR